MMIARFSRWLSTPFRACRALFPFGHEGRQTLIYLVLAGSGPALTLAILWAMGVARDAGQWAIFGNMADHVGWSLLIIVCALACFVSIRAIKIGKDGASVEGRAEAAQATADAAQEQADAIKEVG